VSAALLAPLCTAAAQQAARPRGGARATPSPSPTSAARQRVVSLSPARLAGTYVGTLDDETFVLTVRTRSGADPVVDCSFNTGLKEPMTFGAVIAPKRGLQGRQVPGTDVSFGAVYQDETGRLWIPLVDDRGRVRGELSETKAKDRR